VAGVLIEGVCPGCRSTKSGVAPMDITLDIMSGIEVAADALQILSLFSHLLVVEVSLRSLPCQLCREEIFVAVMQLEL
jgi:hypothetical protein